MKANPSMLLRGPSGDCPGHLSGGGGAISNCQSIRKRGDLPQPGGCSGHPALNRALAQKIAMYQLFFILMVSLICGTEILSFFPISIYAVQIGGGLIVTVTGWSAAEDRPTGSGSPGRQSRLPHDVLGNAFYPYTPPITVGPGSIFRRGYFGRASDGYRCRCARSCRRDTTSALVGDRCRLRHHLRWLFLPVRQPCREGAQRPLGPSSCMRLSSLILVCIGVQIICSGVRAYLATVRA